MRMTQQDLDDLNRSRVARGQRSLTQDVRYLPPPTAASIIGAPTVKELRKVKRVPVPRGPSHLEENLVPEKGFEIQPSKDEAKLNKTERAYLAVLRAQAHFVWIGIQNITVKIADDCRLTPDFATLDVAGNLGLIDVKGFQREDALIKMKVAARMFPMFRFAIVKRDGGNWKTQVVCP